MRTADDQWDITSSVGATALVVAAGRATESRRDDRLVDDPLAQAFVDAAGPVLPVPDGRTPDGTDCTGGTDGTDEGPGAGGDDGDEWVAQAGYQGVRSRFFDEALLGAGTRQVVLLAAGLDARALRLGWPSGTTVFEVDQPRVLGFKDEVIDSVGGTPTARRVTVPVDLRHDWPAALTAAGFDPRLPTAWLAEGLLPYLPADAERLLFERVHALSAPGSRIAVEHIGGIGDRIAADPYLRSLSERLFGTDVRGLFFDEPRTEAPHARLRRYGWTVTARRAADVATDYGRPLDGRIAAMGEVELLSADLG
ncbi:methyltransferase, TIGR00027 family [Pseudonocardia ammonioxydans]|uniref:S-adenosyl-L-methionine-dependent methyltransferase n=1 Tax=Pseudonocardia ammonioxydans TaxID=260086 RepID=A0A1I4UER9_PSUAM|nr:SAM-dependent methyltransferase [Pseudonocardia ammonioxydans]SFM87497.1 methyltransferase, TIGR00027 family [Pseudonocardia ammonioxydans]